MLICKQKIESKFIHTFLAPDIKSFK